MLLHFFAAIPIFSLQNRVGFLNFSQVSLPGNLTFFAKNDTIGAEGIKGGEGIA